MVHHAEDSTGNDDTGAAPDLTLDPALTPEQEEAAMLEKGRLLFAATAKFFFAAQRPRPAAATQRA